jgi:hypothetical protein
MTREACETEGACPVRLMLILLMVVMSAAAGQGCASQDPAARAAEQAAMDNEDDAACRPQGAPGTPAYDDCRKSLAETRARAGAIQEQKRRDFDRVLGAGTSGASETY